VKNFFTPEKHEKKKKKEKRSKKEKHKKKQVLEIREEGCKGEGIKGCG